MVNRSRTRDDPDVRIIRQVRKTQLDECVKGFSGKYVGTHGNFSRKIKMIGKIKIKYNQIFLNVISTDWTHRKKK